MLGMASLRMEILTVMLFRQQFYHIRLIVLTVFSVFKLNSSILPSRYDPDEFSILEESS
jgi:hypothetical protein